MMKVELERQLAEYGRQVDSEITPLYPSDLEAPTTPVRTHRPGWAVAFAAAVVVVVVLGGVAVLLSPDGSQAPVVTQPPAPTVTAPVTVAPDPTIAEQSTTLGAVAPQVLDGEWFDFGPGAGLPGGAYTVSVGPDGTLWSAHLENFSLQLYRYDGVAWQRDGASLDGVENLQWIAVDADGSVISAVCGSGDSAWHLARHADGVWEVFEEPALACARVEAHSMPDGSLLIAGHAFTDLSPLVVTFQGGKPMTRVAQIGQEGSRFNQDAIGIQDSGVAWFAGMNQVTSFDGSNSVRYQLGTTEGEYFSTVEVAPDGSVWSHGIDEIVHISLGEVVRYGELDGVPKTPPGTDISEWRLVPATNGQLWAFREDVIAHYDGDVWRSYERTGRSGLGFPTGRPFSFQVVQAPDGSTFVFDGEYDTLHRLQGGQWSVTLRSLRGSSGHPVVSQMALAPDGSLWFPTTDGVSRFVPDA